MIINNDRWCISEQAGRDIRNWLKFYQNTSHYIVYCFNLHCDTMSFHSISYTRVLIFPYIWNCYRMDEDEVTRPSFWMMWSTCEWLRWWLLDSDAG